MSNEGFRGVPGVPDGWELVGIRKARYMENYIWTSGYTSLWQDSEESDFVAAIIRKIEQPAKYRPFESAEEFKPHIGMYVEVVKETSECEMDLGDTLAIVGVSYDSVLLYGGWITFKDAFECLKFVDGTPFGVKIDE